VNQKREALLDELALVFARAAVDSFIRAQEKAPQRIADARGPRSIEGSPNHVEDNRFSAAAPERAAHV
jgi:hypothetical protein